MVLIQESNRSYNLQLIIQKYISNKYRMNYSKYILSQFLSGFILNFPLSSVSHNSFVKTRSKILSYYEFVLTIFLKDNNVFTKCKTCFISFCSITEKLLMNEKSERKYKEQAYCLSLIPPFQR
jgi:hypothetical protein